MCINRLFITKTLSLFSPATIFLITPVDFHYHKFSFSFRKIGKCLLVWFDGMLALVSKSRRIPRDGRQSEKQIQQKVSEGKNLEFHSEGKDKQSFRRLEFKR